MSDDEQHDGDRTEVRVIKTNLFNAGWLDAILGVPRQSSHFIYKDGYDMALETRFGRHDPISFTECIKRMQEKGLITIECVNSSRPT